MGERRNKSGFTVVELLIVIVIVAILAAITYVVYVGIQNRAISSKLQLVAEQSMKQIENARTLNNTSLYPANLTDANLASQDGVTLNYYPGLTRDSYCVEASQSNQYVAARSATQTVAPGRCLESSLIAWWPFNGTANDQWTSGINGSVSGAVATAGQKGQANTAYYFDGIDDFMDFGNPTVLATTGTSFSVTAWINRQTTSTSEIAIIRKSDLFQLGFASSGSASRNLLGTYGGTTGWTAANDFNYTFTPGTWYLYSFAWDGATFKTYINGNLAKTATVTGAPVTSTNNLVMSSPGLWYRGSLDDVRLYSRGLTADEMMQLYTAGAQ